MQHNVFCEDVEVTLAAQHTGSVDLVLYSPPYEDCRTYGIEEKRKGKDWVYWQAKVLMEALRVSRGLVCCVVEGRTKQFQYTATPILLMSELVAQGASLRKPLIYRRNGVPGSGGPDWMRNDYEFVICGQAAQGPLPWANNTACGKPPVCKPGGRPSHRKTDGSRVEGNYKPPALANPGNIVDCRESSSVIDIGAAGGGNIGSELAHENEAPFPEKLAEFIVMSFCPTYGTVLDPFCGSGTVAAVCERLSRNSINSDLRQSQVELTLRRIAEAQAQPKGSKYYGD
jgi:16S rRNA G966 N2-methylase RsmD